MSVYTYNEILNNAKKVKTNVSKEYKIGMSHKWSYYFAKALLTPKDIPKISIADAPQPSHTHISRQMTSKQYLELAKTFVNFVETKKRLPNYLAWKGYHISSSLYTYTFARCLTYHNAYGKYDPEITINQKVFTKPSETGNKVYDYACKKYGKKFKTIDDILAYVQKHFKYEYYFDDHKSNKQVTDSKAGNCTDLLQWLCNMVEPIGYEWKCIHVKCRVSGTGHVFGKFRKKGHTEWFIRDIASVADGGSINSVWCRDGIVLATNPSWWIANKNR